MNVVKCLVGAVSWATGRVWVSWRRFSFIHEAESWILHQCEVKLRNVVRPTKYLTYSAEVEARVTWLDSSRKFEDLRLAWQTAIKDSARLWLGTHNLRLDLTQMTQKSWLFFLFFSFFAHIETLLFTYEQTVLRQAQRTVTDPSHILHLEYDLLPSGRRYRVPHCKLKHFKNSFVPTSIKFLNNAAWGRYVCNHF